MTGLLVVIAAGVGALMVAIVCAVVKDALTNETRAWLPHLSQRLLDSVANQLPETERERAEEWEAELSDYRDRPLTMLIVALRIRRDGNAIVREVRDAALQREQATTARRRGVAVESGGAIMGAIASAVRRARAGGGAPRALALSRAAAYGARASLLGATVGGVVAIGTGAAAAIVSATAAAAVVAAGGVLAAALVTAILRK